MSADHAQPLASRALRRSRSPSLLLLFATALGLLLAAAAIAAPIAATPTREVGRLSSSLTAIARLVDRQVQPRARGLARGLPGSAEQLRALREPAGTTQDQVEVALDELRQMSIPAILDPHYAPALLAAGRAFLAASGEDPLTRTTVDPEYLGLERELAAAEAKAVGSAQVAAQLSARVGRLHRALARTRRRAGRLTRQLRHHASARRP